MANADTIHNRCNICGEEYGYCDEQTHQKEIGDNYAFDMNVHVETNFFRFSLSPRLSKIRVKNGVEMADVARTIYITRR